MNEFYKQLLDLYAGGELTDELKEELESAAFRDPELTYEMTTLKKTVDILHSVPEPTFTEESYQRILMKLYARGVELQTQSPDPTHLQLQLPIHT